MLTRLIQHNKPSLGKNLSSGRDSNKNMVVKTLTGRDYDYNQENMNLYLSELKNMFLTVFEVPLQNKQEKMIKGIKYLTETPTEWP